MKCPECSSDIFVYRKHPFRILYWCERNIGSTRDFLSRSQISDEKTVRGVQKRFREFTGERIKATQARKLLSASAAEKGERVKRENWRGRYVVVWRTTKGRIRTWSRWP